MKSSGGGPALERKIVEKNRRIHMKSLFLKLASLIPKHTNSFKDAMTQLDHLDQAMAYIEDIRERVERLKDKAKRIEGSSNYEGCSNNAMTTGFRLPVIKIEGSDSSLEIVLISGLNKNFLFHEIIRVLEEEGTEVLNASFSIVDHKIFHTIHSKAFCARVGLDVVMIWKRVKELID